ncbi:MAG: helix-turn-helix domain-containing protein [Candidatus Thiodiazotropha sp. (ex Lucinoma borealis)]|nr:helix-turn-helix domain-containing protein [Candidatus Thiodiazotropha sp. (ex Lucinoma borealis)]
MNEYLGTPPGAENARVTGVGEKQIHFNTSTSAQRNAILSFLRTGEHLTTLYARETLGIMHPAMRVKELRNQSHKIITHWSVEEDVTETRHRVASYVLMSGTLEETA